LIYLDSAATAKYRNIDDIIVNTIITAMRDSWQNPSSLYAVNVKDKINKCRANIAEFIGAEPNEIYFTSGASESNNWAIRGWVDETWLDIYKTSKSEREQEKVKALIVIQMVPVIKKIARTIARRSTDPIEDLVQAGFIGLLKAIDKYDINKNDNFRVYAGYLIIGEMKHFLRDKVSAIRVPRHIQELTIRINNFTQSLTYEEVNSLTCDEVAVALDVSKNVVDLAMQVERRRTTVSFEEIYKVGDDNLPFDEIYQQENYEEQAKYEDARIFFEKVIEKLPPEEKVIIDMYYKQNMTQKEIADALQLTQMKVCRKLKAAFDLIAELAAESKIKKEDIGDD